MKKIIVILLVTISGSQLIAQKSTQAFLTKSLAGQSVKNVEAETSGGNISVVSVPDGDARIEVFVQSSKKNNGNASKEEIQKIIDEHYDLQVDVTANRLKALARRKDKNWNRNNSLSISFRVFTPANVSTELSTSGGNIDLHGISGEQDITTSGGNLDIDHVTGKLKGVTSGGNIQVRESADFIDLTTSGGNIEATNCKGEIKLVTSGGSIRLANLTGNTEAVTSGGNVEANTVSGELEASTSGGNIDLKALSGNLTTATSGGDIRVEVKEPGKFIKIRNSGGNITLQLPAGKGYDLDLSAKKIKTDNLSGFNGKTSEDEMSGKLNGGGSKVDVEGRDGNLILTLK